MTIVFESEEEYERHAKMLATATNQFSTDVQNRVRFLSVYNVLLYFGMACDKGLVQKTGRKK